jgi:hypothetical protein
MDICYDIQHSHQHCPDDALLEKCSMSLTAMTLSGRVLGTFRVTVCAALIPELTWQRRNAATVVKLLALAPGAPFTANSRRRGATD